MDQDSEQQPGQGREARVEIGETEARFFLSSIVGTLQDSVVTIDLQGIITSWNAAAEEVYGYSADEAIGQPLKMVLLPEDFDGLAEKIQIMRNGGSVPLYNTIRVRKDSQLINLEVTLSPVRDAGGQLIGVSTVGRDVTRLRKTEDDLKSSASHLRAILESARDFAIITLDRDGHITEWNKGAEYMFGYTREEILGLHTEILFTPEDRKVGISKVEMDIAEKTGRSMNERWHVNKNGSRFFMSGVMTMVDGSREAGYVKVARNITDRKLAEEALLLSEQRTSLVVESAGMGEWEWNITDDSVGLSEQAKQLLGISDKPDTTQMSRMLELVVPAERDYVRKALATALDGLYIFQAEYRVLRPDNQHVIWLNVYGRVVAHVNERPSKMIGVMYDVTARKSLEKQKDDFISVASHELRTPVTSIKLYSELLEESMTSSQEFDNLELLRNLNGQIDRLINLIQTLLDTNTVSEGRMVLRPQPLDLNKLISEQAALLKPMAGRHVLDLQLGVVPIIHADPERITQVITNLVSNAVKYSPAGAPIVIRTEDKLSSVLVTVIDQGPGVPADMQPLIFERYYRVPGEANKGRDGFGLGLYICAEIIRQHHGEIGVHSTPGQGASFYFTLQYS